MSRSGPAAPGDFLGGGYKVKRVERNRPPYRYRVENSANRSLEVEELPVPLTGRKLKTRLRDQKRLLSWVRHPQIRLPLDLVRTACGVGLVRMNPRGEPLERRLFREPTTPREALRWASELCALLGYLHSHGLALGRLSPANLWLDPDGRVQLAGFALSSDLGITPELPEDAPTNIRAPESEPDARSDVFCVGRLIGYLMQWATNPPALGWVQENELEKVVARATHPEPGQRYADCLGLKAALDSVRFGRYTSYVPRPRTLSTMELIPRIARGAVSALAVLLVLCGVSLVKAGWDEQHRVPGYRLSQLGELPPGARVRVEGALRADGETVRSPLSEDEGLGYTTRVTRKVRQEVWDPVAEQYAVREFAVDVVDQSVLGPVRLEQDGSGVTVRADSVEVLGPLVPAPVRGAPPPEVGQQVLFERGQERLLSEGETVEIEGRAVRLDGRIVLTGHLKVLPGGASARRALLLQACLPGLLLILAAGLLLSPRLKYLIPARGRFRQGPLGRLASVDGGLH